MVCAVQIKAAIQEFVAGKDVEVFARRLAVAVRGSVTAQAAVPSLAATVSRSKRDAFQAQLQVWAMHHALLSELCDCHP